MVDDIRVRATRSRDIRAAYLGELYSGGDQAGANTFQDPFTGTSTGNGYSIGRWHDEDKDGAYDMLSIETRGIKGPRSIDSTGVVLHENDKTVVHEEIRRIDATTLEDKITTIDDAFTRPWTINQRYRHNAENIIWVEYVCAEGNRHVKLGDEWYFLNDAEGGLIGRRRRPSIVRSFGHRRMFVGGRRISAFGIRNGFGVLHTARAHAFGVSENRKARQCQQSNH